MATNLILPVIEEPGVDVDQFVITEGAEPSTEAALPALVIGVKHRAVGPVVLSEAYTGLLKKYTFPDFELKSIVLNDDSLKITLLNTVVKLKNTTGPNLGTVTHNVDDIVIAITNGDYTTPAPGGATGLIFGDNALVRTSLVAPIGNTVVTLVQLADLISTKTIAFNLNVTVISTGVLSTTAISQVFDTDQLTTAQGIQTAVQAVTGILSLTLSGSNRTYTITARPGYIVTVSGITVTSNQTSFTNTSSVPAGTGLVDIASRDTMTDIGSTTQFANIIPGDILVFKAASVFGDINWKSTNSSSITEYVITEVGTDGVSIKVDGTLGVGSGIAYSIVREINTNITSAATIDAAGTKFNVSHDIPAGPVEFKLTRTLVAGTVNGDQPLATDYQLVSGNFDLVDGTDAGDSFQVHANLAISGFTKFTVAAGGTGALVVSSNAKLLTVAGVDLTTGVNAVAAGDTIYFINTGGVAVGATVASISFSSPNTLITLVETQATDVTASAVYIGYHDGIGITRPIATADIQVVYKARCTKDHAKLIKIKTTSDLDSTGDYAIYNELRVAAQVCKLNAGTNAIYAIPVKDTSPESFAQALETAEGGLLYNVVLLTQSASIQSGGKVHVDSMSIAVKALWRVLWANQGKPSEGFVVPNKASGILTLTVTLSGSAPNKIIVDGSKVYLTDAQADFTDVAADQFLKFYLQSGVAKPLPQTGGTLVNSASFVNSDDATVYFRIYRVKTVVNKTKIECYPNPYEGTAGSGIYTEIDPNTMLAETGLSYTGKYEVIKILTKDEIAQAIGHIGQGLSDRRVNYIINSICRIAFTNSDGLEVLEDMNGYIAGAALAGLNSNTKPHQPLTRVPLAGIAGIRDGREFFSSEQLSVIATGGGWILVQDDLDISPVYTWRQLTTSRGSLKEKEHSFTKNLDEISYALFFDLQRFPGRNNNVAKTIASIDAQIRATLEVRKTTESKSITGGDLGPQIINYTQQGTIPDPLLLDTVFNRITLTLPLPLNKIKVTVFA